MVRALPIYILRALCTSFDRKDLHAHTADGFFESTINLDDVQMTGSGELRDPVALVFANPAPATERRQ